MDCESCAVRLASFRLLQSIENGETASSEDVKNGDGGVDDDEGYSQEISPKGCGSKLRSRSGGDLGGRTKTPLQDGYGLNDARSIRGESSSREREQTIEDRAKLEEGLVMCVEEMERCMCFQENILWRSKRLIAGRTDSYSTDRYPSTRAPKSIPEDSQYHRCVRSRAQTSMSGSIQLEPKLLARHA
jgi:hypothetical protein